MKIIFMLPALTHYYNLVLSKLNLEPEADIIVISPSMAGENIGAAVYQTREGINFKVIALEEKRLLSLYLTFSGLAEVLLQEKPDVIVVDASYLHAFLFDIPVARTRKKIRCGLILKSIPFRLLPYQEACQIANKSTTGFSRLPLVINRFMRLLGVIRYVRRVSLAINKSAYCLVDAHVNYIEAFEIWCSYGVPRERVFLTRNSPDTDLLLSIKSALTNAPSIFPHNPYRLLHVGRLVEWKRVDMLIRAFSRVKERFPEAELLIVGTGPDEAGLKMLAQDLNLGTSVIFTGGVYDPHLLGQYFMASSLYVLAGMGGLSINDAMCFALPVLCSVGDGTEKFLVREGINGRFFLDGDEDDLVDKIIWFFDHHPQLQEMGRKSQGIIRNKVNIHTVINVYMDAFNYVHKRACK
jgi:glycosyltransferase involved in cell wall biosynthesis